MANREVIEVYLPRSGPYRVTFRDGKPSKVTVRVIPYGKKPYDRALWYTHASRMSITAACAIRAAQAKRAAELDDGCADAERRAEWSERHRY